MGGEAARDTEAATPRLGAACPAPLVADDASLGAVLWRSGLWRILVVLLVWSVGFSTLLPITPTIFTNFFASRLARHSVDCEATSELPACVDAHAQVVQWSSLTSFVSNSVVSFLFQPLVGDASDRYGRKPFLVAAFVLALLPSAVVVAHLTVPSPGDLLLLYYPASAVSGVVSAIVVCLSYCADKLPARHRTAGFGLIIAAFSLGFVAGPVAGAALSARSAALLALAATAGCAAAVAVAVPESLPPAVAALGRQRRAAHPRTHPLNAALSLGRSWALINSRSFFRRLALCLAILGIVQGGVEQTLVQYLQLTLGFTTRDQGALFATLGATNLVVQVLVLPVLVPLLGEKKLLVLGLAVSAVEQALLAVAAAKWQALGAIALGSIAGVSFPAISAMKANHCSDDEQGLVQGALGGLRALSTGLGPLLYSALFAACTTTGGALSGRPGLVFWASAALTAASLAVAVTVRVPEAPAAAAAATTGEEVGVVAAFDAEAAIGAEAAAEPAGPFHLKVDCGGPGGGGGGGDGKGDAAASPDQRRRPRPRGVAWGAEERAPLLPEGARR